MEFLSIMIRQRPGHITIDQEQYIRTVFDKYQLYISVVTILIRSLCLNILHVISHRPLPNTLLIFLPLC